MTRVVREAVVRAPPGIVFALLVDPRERRHWLASMKEDFLEGALRVGITVKGRRTATGSRSTYESRILRVDAPRCLEAEIYRNGDRVGLAGFDLAETHGGTRVSAWGDVELKGLQRMLAPVVAAGMEKELDADLQGLKRHAEAKTVAPEKDSAAPDARPHTPP